MAEAYLNSIADGRFRAYSAGSRPTGKVNPYALALLRKKGIATRGLRSKSWIEFAMPGAPQMDFILTVCDGAAGERCPIWPGRPAKEHLGVPDPAMAQGSEEKKARGVPRRVRAALPPHRRSDREVSVPCATSTRRWPARRPGRAGAAGRA